MSHRSIIDSYTIFSAVDASTNQNSLSTPTNTKRLDNCGLQVTWTGTCVGTFQVYCSNDKLSPSNWQALDFGSAVNIDVGVEPNRIHLLNVNQMPFSWLAVKYTATSGTGSLSVVLTSKNMGG